MRKPLAPEQIQTLASQGCAAADWALITAAAGFDARRVRNARFIGAVSLGANGGEVDSGGVRRPAGIANATIANCDIGDDVFISNVGSVLSNLTIGDGVAIENAALIAAEPFAACGVGTKVETINEGGGREAPLFGGLSAQIAYMQALWRHNRAFVEALEGLIEAEVKSARSEKAVIAAGARVANCGPIRNVTIGPQARVDGAALLENGTILSCAEAPTIVGAGVQARSFIFSEGAVVDAGANLDKVFVGQGARVGRLFSAENCLFFANCEAFNGEGCALFAGPYTVTHHKSTLLIAGLYSFFNAGSGTNQSNHMYKLGPVHQGVIERGCKTGSFSYLLLESHIGAFSLILGKHATFLDTPNMPFSYLVADGGATSLIPAVNLATIGTVRDGEKWPARDRRKAGRKRDLIVFDVYSPYTIEKMRRGRDDLKRLCEAPGAETTGANYGGARVTFSRMRRGAQLYKSALDRYLCGKVLDRIEAGLAAGLSFDALRATLKPSGQTRRPTEWTDAAGLIALRERMAAVEADVASGAVSSIAQLEERLCAIYEGYAQDEWEYVCAACEAEYGARPDGMTVEQWRQADETWSKQSLLLLSAVVEDAKKEFNDPARIGYGLDQDEENARLDFEAVRGAAETNSTIRKIESEIAAVKERAAALQTRLSSLAD